MVKALDGRSWGLGFNFTVLATWETLHQFDSTLHVYVYPALQNGHQVELKLERCEWLQQQKLRCILLRHTRLLSSEFPHLVVIGVKSAGPAGISGCNYTTALVSKWAPKVVCYELKKELLNFSEMAPWTINTYLLVCQSTLEFYYHLSLCQVFTDNAYEFIRFFQRDHYG